MPDYREMYLKLYRAHAKVLAILNQATLETEEIAMEAKDPVALFVDSGEDVGDNEE